MTAEKLSTIASIVLSLAFSYLPGLKDAYDRLDGVVKRLVMLLMLALTTGAIFAISCAPVVSDYIPVECTPGGAIALLQAFILAVIANQSTFLISPKFRSH